MRSTITILFTFLLTQINGQDSTFFQFDQIHFNQIDSVEINKKSKEIFVNYSISVSADYFPNAASFDLAQPRVFDRSPMRDFIACQINYYFTKSDSIVRLISYTWDTKNSATSLEDLMKPKNDQSDKMDKYNSEYDLLAKELTKQLGAPVEGTGQIEKKQEKGYPDWFERKLLWTKGKTTIELFMIWTDGGGRLGTYKIRTLVYWNN